MASAPRAIAAQGNSLLVHLRQSQEEAIDHHLIPQTPTHSPPTRKEESLKNRVGKVLALQTWEPS